MYMLMQAPDTVISDLESRYKVAPGEFVLEEMYVRYNYNYHIVGCFHEIRELINTHKMNWP